VHDALAKIEANPQSATLYAQVLAIVEDLGECKVEVKQTSLHVVHGRAFLGIHPRKDGLLLNLVTTEPLRSDRLKKVDQVSANRWHNEVLVSSELDIDAQLRRWLKAAYRLTKN
jgi:hypothetical protein